MTENNEDWATGYKKQKEEEKAERRAEYPELPKFKLEDGETKQFTFLTNGRKIDGQFGKAIVFNVQVDGLDHVWFVRDSMFMVLNPITENMPVEGKKASLSRVGKGMKDTRYSFKFLEEVVTE